MSKACMLLPVAKTVNLYALSMVQDNRKIVTCIAFQHFYVKQIFLGVWLIFMGCMMLYLFIVDRNVVKISISCY